MAISKAEPTERLHDDENSAQKGISLWPLVGYFLKLGTIGFGGPAALVGFMHRDLVEQRRWITEDTYKLSLALAQIMPGPLAAQTAIAIGYFEGGVLGATLVGLGFIIPSFLMVVAISLAYVSYGGLWWMQALFYAIGATVIAIIAIAAYKLARSTNKRNPLLWGIFAVLTVVTVWAQTELAEFFILAGLIVLVFQAWPGWKPGILMVLSCATLGVAVWLMESWLGQAGTGSNSGHDIDRDPIVFYQSRRVCVRQRPGNRSVLAPGSCAAVRLAERASVFGRRRRRDDHSWSRSHHRRFHRVSRCRLGGSGYGVNWYFLTGVCIHDRAGTLV